MHCTDINIKDHWVVNEVYSIGHDRLRNVIFYQLRFFFLIYIMYRMRIKSFVDISVSIEIYCLDRTEDRIGVCFVQYSRCCVKVRIYFNLPNLWH